MIETVKELQSKLSRYSKADRERVLKAARWAESLHADQKRASGEPYLIHPLQVAQILLEMRMDAETLIAALLHDVLEDTEITRQEMRKECGKEVESLVNGVTKISILRAKNKSVQQAETIRKMLFAMVKDIRVILIKLADKLHNMRTLEFLPEDRRRATAIDTIDIYAPLAGRLGISWMKDELEDLSLKHLNRDAYDQIKRFVAQKREERAAYLRGVERAIRGAARQEGVEVTLQTRAKHFYSIYKKMKRKGRKLDEIYDILGIRIMCRNQTECYTILGIVHRLWIPIEGRFKDYIAMPKANRYQSLHTTVMCYEGKLIEIQIRTEEMHRTAEYGIAAHWIYKQGFVKEKLKAEELAIINKLKSWNGIRITSGEFLEEIKRELLKDSIYVFTPKGDVIELPTGSTAIDFAYHIHTEVGNHCVGAKADGAIIPLSQELRNTQVIEVMTASSARPHLSWLRQVRTARARQKVRAWLNKHDETLFIDRSIVAKKKEPQPKPETHPKPEPAAKSEQQAVPDEVAELQGKTTVIDMSRIGIRAGSERNMMIRLAGCCSPTTGDAIIGYVSRGRGIIVHKRNCPNLTYIRDFDERKIDVEWETVSPKATRRFKVTARRSSDLFSEIEGAVRKFHGHLIEGKLTEDDGGRLTGYFTMELDNRDDFKRVMKSLKSIPSVVNIQSVGSQILNPTA
jgi:GTP pyrophosphokinase